MVPCLLTYFGAYVQNIVFRTAISDTHDLRYLRQLSQLIRVYEV